MALQANIDSLVDEIESMDDASYSDHHRQRALYDYISKKIRPNVPPNTSPPRQVIVYAIRSILIPSFVLQEIPNLLRLLVHLEVVRQTQVRIMRTLLDKQKEALLSHDAIKNLQDRTKESLLDAQRDVYRKNIHACCLLHIHHLWRTYDSDVDRPLQDVFATYFPALGKRDPDLRDKCDAALKHCPWNHDLSEDELIANADAGREAAQFMFDAALFMEDPDSFCQERGEFPTTFEERFPPPDSELIAKGIEGYIGMVSRSAAVLDAVLG